MKNIPKKVNVYCTNHSRVGYGKEDIVVEKFLEISNDFNENGKIVKEYHYIAENGLDSLTVNDYNEKGELTSTAQYDGEGNMGQKLEFFYDDNGNVVKQNNYYGEDCPTFSNHFIFENGLLIRQDSYDDGNFVYTEKEYRYNDKGLLIEQIDFDEDGNKQYVTVNEYNDDGLVITRVRDEILEKDRRTYHFEYENKNKVKDLIYDYDEMLIAKIYYKYNENRDVIETEEEDLDNYRKTVYCFEGKKLIKVEISDREGRILSWTEYEYDEQDNIQNIVNYIRDEVDENDYRIFTEYHYERIYE